MAEVLSRGLVAGVCVNWRSWASPLHVCRNGDDGGDNLDGIIADLRFLIGWWIEVAPDERKTKVIHH